MAPSFHGSFYRDPSSSQLPDRNPIGWSGRGETARVEICPHSSTQNPMTHGDSLKPPQPLSHRSRFSLIHLAIARLMSFLVWTVALTQATLGLVFVSRRGVGPRNKDQPSQLLQWRYCHPERSKRGPTKKQGSPDSEKECPGKKQPRRHGVSDCIREPHQPNQPFSLKRLVLLVILAVNDRMADAQYTEMIAWITGSNVEGTVTGVSNSYPRARFQHGAFFDSTYKLFHVFGGRTTSTVPYNDLWRYSLKSDTWTLLSSTESLTAGNTGSYGTIGQESSTFLPSARYDIGDAYAPQSRFYYLFGGYNAGYLGGLWRYSLAADTWALLSASSQYGIIPAYTGSYGTESLYYRPGARRSAALAVDYQGSFLYMYGGFGYSRTSLARLDELWRFNIVTKQWAFLSGTIDASSVPIYGVRGIPASTNYPGGRSDLCSFYDPKSRLFYIAFGAATITGKWMNDVWSYNPTDRQWTWISGSNGIPTSDLSPAFPARGVEATEPAPCIRKQLACYFNPYTSILYLMGGYGTTSSGTPDDLGDIWRFDINTLKWSFIGGKMATGLAVTFGNRGIEATTNSMGSFTGAGLFQDGNRIYLSTGLSGSSYYSAIMSSRIICPPYQYWKNFHCYPCTGDMLTQVIDGRSSCGPCTPNWHCYEGKLSCAPGFTSSATGCVACSATTYKNVHGTQVCTNCPLNAVCSSTGFTCNAGFTLSGTTSCVACAANTYKSDTGNQACTSCPLNAVVCSRTSFTCNAGFYATKTDCLACDSGTYKNAIGNQACSNCLSNAVCSSTDFSCNAGYYFNGASCIACGAGTYKDVTGNQKCTSCPTNWAVCTTTDFLCAAGYSRSGTQCQDCSAGMYKTDIGNQGCLSCPDNAVCFSASVACNAGFYFTGTSCADCAPNTYKSDIGLQGCTNCPPNSVCSSTEFTCNAGFYHNGASCVACPSGTYKSAPGNDVCTSCPVNWVKCTTTSFICNIGYYSGEDSCLPCEQGTFRNTITSALCSPCPENSVECSTTSFTCGAGYFGTETDCVACASGTYKSSPGIQACTNCPPNSVCTGTEFTCSAGFYLSGAKCLACGTGTYKDVPGNEGCTSCPLNSASCTTTSFTCKAGYFLDGASCVVCGPGTYKSATGNQQCVNCPENAVCSSTSVTCKLGFFFDENVCAACQTGTYKNVIGNQACTSCPLNSASCTAAGFTCNPGYFSTGTSCVDCKTGTSTNIPGSQACLNCPIGSYASGTSENQACTICPSGSYSDVLGSISCTVCPPGATCSTTSLTCNPGYFKNNINTCTICPVNTFKDTAGNDRSSCLTCPSNFFTCNSTTLVCDRGFERIGAMCSPCSTSPSMFKPLIGNHACSSCPAGATCNSTDFTCLEGRSQTGSSCSACPVNMYKDWKGNNACLSCPIGAACNSTDFTCLEGRYRTGSNCSVCPVNTYKDWKGNNACFSCPIGASCVGSASFVCLTGYKKTGSNCTVVSSAPTDAAVEGISCPTGATCNEAGFTCTAGYFQNGTLCLPCDSHTFKSFDGNLQACLPCPEAATCTRTDFTCHSGYYRSGNNCSACPANTFKSVAGNEVCSSCPGNAVCDTRSFACNAGFFAAGSVCSPCASGFYKPKASNDLCLVCPTGSTCNGTTYQCNAGYSASNGGCSPCSDGFYKPSIGNKECLACPDHASCDQTSFSCFAGYFEDGSVCSPCQEGTYNNKVGAKSCSPCPKYATCSSTSFVCQAGFNKRESSCADCPQGSFKESDGTCGLCPSNSLCESDIFFCYPGYTKLGKGCVPCVTNKYKAFIGNDACLNCPNGAVCDGTYFTCAPGYQLFLGVCVSCSTNNFKPSVGNTSCLVCPDDASCTTTAITACPSGYQPGELDCQQVSKGTNIANASSLGPMYIAIIGGIGGLLFVLCVALVVYYVRSRAQTKAALELSGTSMSRLDIRSLGRGGTLRTFTESQSAINRSYSGSSTALNAAPIATNSAPTATNSGFQLNNKHGPIGTSTSSALEFGGRTFVSKTPDFLEVTENQDYSRVKKISEGAMGEVWLSHASQPALVERGDSYKCVIKVIKSSAKVSWEVFQQEITISYHAREHPNIAQIIGFSRSPFIIVLRYYPQGSLDSLLYKRQMKGFSWSVAWSRSFALDIALGLSHMHKLSIAHCDIKPGNILLKYEKDSLVALLSDFGISRILDGQASVVAGFQTHNLNGVSLNYASPETFARFRRRGDPSVNYPQVIKAGDVYSLAVVVCEMLIRKRPWTG